MATQWSLLEELQLCSFILVTGLFQASAMIDGSLIDGLQHLDTVLG